MLMLATVQVVLLNDITHPGYFGVLCQLLLHRSMHAALFSKIGLWCGLPYCWHWAHSILVPAFVQLQGLQPIMLMLATVQVVLLKPHRLPHGMHQPGQRPCRGGKTPSCANIGFHGAFH